MTTGTIYPNTPEHPSIWWLAAEILADSHDGPFPEGLDPRVWSAAEWPYLHLHWIQRIREYMPTLDLPLNSKDLNA